MTLFTLITGASGGIGMALAKVFAENGHSLILVARSVRKLEALAKDLRKRYAVEVHVIPADLSTAQGPVKLYAAVKKKKLPVENLVNNAGMGTNGPFIEQDWNKEKAMLQLNVVSLVELTALFLPQMKERGGGSILNVASTAAFQPGPFMANYYASKSHVLYFSEALATELKPYHISVTALCPGATRTDFFDRAGMQESGVATSPLMMTSEKVAAIGYDGWHQKKAVVIPGFLNWFVASTVGLMPRAAVRFVASHMNR